MFCWDTCLALPTTTLWAHGCIISMKEPWSKKPLCHEPFGALYTEVVLSRATENRKVKSTLEKKNILYFKMQMQMNPFSENIILPYLKISDFLAHVILGWEFLLLKIVLGSILMDDFIRRLAQLFFCLHTPRNMPSLWGYDSIKPLHSSLPETMIGFSYCPNLFADLSCNYTDAELSPDL